jgi:class 3 adenylate cyclase
MRTLQEQDRHPRPLVRKLAKAILSSLDRCGTFRRWVSIAGQRRWIEQRAAVLLAVDIASYSRLIEQDALGTALRVKRLRHQLLHPYALVHRGQVLDCIGDAALLAFNEASNALACAIAIQRALADAEATDPMTRRLELKMGIGAGEVLIVDGEVFGIAVITAFRLSALAEPGDILLCADAVHRLADRGPTDQLEPLGTRQLRNLSAPVIAFRVSQAQVQPHRVPDDLAADRSHRHVFTEPDLGVAEGGIERCAA